MRFRPTGNGRRADRRRRPDVAAFLGDVDAHPVIVRAEPVTGLDTTGLLLNGGMSSDVRPDPIAEARKNWENAGWGDVAGGMQAVTSVMRVHQILLARVESVLKPWELSFSRFELLRLLAFSRRGALPITKASDRLQVHVTSVTHAIRRLEESGLVRRVPHPTDGRTTLVEITESGRTTVEEATLALNREVFGDVGMTEAQSAALVKSINAVRKHWGDI